MIIYVVTDTYDNNVYVTTNYSDALKEVEGQFGYCIEEWEDGKLMGNL